MDQSNPQNFYSHPTKKVVLTLFHLTDALIFDRKKLLEISSRLIEETYERISGDRFRVRDGDRERLQYLRALTGLIALHTALLEKANSPSLEGYSRKRDPLDDILDEEYVLKMPTFRIE